MGPGRLFRQARQIEGLAYRHHRRQVPTGLSDRVPYEPVHAIGGAAEEYQADVTSTEQPVDRDRVDVVREGFLSGELGLQITHMILRVAHFRAEIVDDAARSEEH